MLNATGVWRTAARSWPWAAAVGLLLALVPIEPVRGQLPTGFSREVVLTENGITSLHYAPDGRLFITRQNGQVRIFKDGNLLKTPYATLGVSQQNERGLVGLALDPDFTTNCFVYVYYTTGPTSPSFSGTVVPRISRLHGCGDVADPGETILRDFPTTGKALSYHHNGGDLQFGPDGKLYVGIGDAGNSSLAQKLGNFRGKLLRLNSDGTAAPGNPFVGVAGALPEIWAYGFRNPWRMTFRPSNNALIAGDVGAKHWEEIDYVFAGGNYAWNVYEGPCKRNEPAPKEADCTPDPTTYPAKFEYPILFYPHPPVLAPLGDGPEPDHVGEGNAAVIGGVFVNGGNYPAAFQGRYFFGDFVQHFVHTVVMDASNQVVLEEPFDMLPGGPATLTVDPDGNVLVYDWGSDNVFRFVYTP